MTSELILAFVFGHKNYGEICVPVCVIIWWDFSKQCHLHPVATHCFTWYLTPSLHWTRSLFASVSRCKSSL